MWLAVWPSHRKLPNCPLSSLPLVSAPLPSPAAARGRCPCFSSSSSPAVPCCAVAPPARRPCTKTRGGEEGHPSPHADRRTRCHVLSAAARAGWGRMSRLPELEPTRSARAQRKLEASHARHRQRSGRLAAHLRHRCRELLLPPRGAAWSSTTVARSSAPAAEGAAEFAGEEGRSGGGR